MEFHTIISRFGISFPTRSLILGRMGQGHLKCLRESYLLLQHEHSPAYSIPSINNILHHVITNVACDGTEQENQHCFSAARQSAGAISYKLLLQ